jgi:hypothetical protein
MEPSRSTGWRPAKRTIGTRRTLAAIIWPCASTEGASPRQYLIPTRIALALIEPQQTDLILGDGARQGGGLFSHPAAVRDRLVWCDGENEPTRVRAGWVTDTDIAAMVAVYRLDGGQVVVDLTDEPRLLEGQES